MFPLFETFKVIDGKIIYSEYHQKRVLYGRYKVFGHKQPLDLSMIPSDKGVFRCRIEYNKYEQKIFMIPYEPTIITTLQPVNINFHYSLKWTERSFLNHYKKSTEKEPLFIKNGFVTDTLTANIAVKLKGCWFTPSTPLLYGTTRQRLIDEGILVPKTLVYHECLDAEQIVMINALRDFDTTSSLKILQGETNDSSI